jgi:exopolysaccharide biosynthesis polyprenyl glycosylphosphotransferase
MTGRKVRALRSQKLLLAAFDLVAVSLAFLVGRWLIRTFHPYGQLMPPFGFWHFLGVILIAIAWLYIGRSQGLYNDAIYSRRLSQIPAIVRTVVLGMFAPFVYDYATRTNVFVERRSVPLTIGCLALVLFLAFRLVLFRAIHRRMLRRGYWASRVLVLGEGEEAKRISHRIVGFDPMRLQFAGFVDLKELVKEGRPASELVGNAIKENRADEVVVAMPALSHQDMLEIRDSCGNGGVRVSFVSDLFQTLSERVDLSRIEGVPLLELKDRGREATGRAIKRIVDVGVSAFLLVLLAPLMLVCAFAVRRTSSGPALHKQKRIGRDGKQFILYKFRTMYQEADKGENIHRTFVTEMIKNGSAKRDVYKMAQDPRITRIGQFLRRTSLDELPQLINVLKGDMSLVGPRPPLFYEIESYANWHKRRLSVRPGITGLWQVSGRSEVPFDEMVMLDLYYIENWSLWTDVSIMLKTLPAVVSGKGAY